MVYTWKKFVYFFYVIASMEQTVYEFSFDLIRIAQAFIVFCILLYLIRQKHMGVKNHFVYLLSGLVLVGILSSHLIVFTTAGIPNLVSAVTLGIGPTIYFYLKTELSNQFPDFKALYRHLLLGAIVLIMALFKLNCSIEPYLTFFVLIHFGFYLFLSINDLASKKVVVLKDYGHTNNSSVKWLNLFYGVIVITFVYLTAIVETFFLSPRMEYRYTFIAFALAIAFLLTRAVAYKIRAVYQFYKKRNEIKAIEKYKDSVLSKPQSEALALKLSELMLSKKPYLDDEIDLAALALLLKTHPKNISQVINENFNRNFFDYINSLRIEEAKKMLADPAYKDYKIYEIMYEVGFNSRSSFNTAFKKFAGNTAKQFKDQTQ